MKRTAEHAPIVELPASRGTMRPGAMRSTGVARDWRTGWGCPRLGLRSIAAGHGCPSVPGPSLAGRCLMTAAVPFAALATILRAFAGPERG